MPLSRYVLVDSHSEAEAVIGSHISGVFLHEPNVYFVPICQYAEIDIVFLCVGAAVVHGLFLFGFVRLDICR